jgi:hypothetical protein
LRVHGAVRRDGAREKLGRVSLPGTDFRDAHARSNAGEREELRGTPPLIERSIVSRSIGRGESGRERGNGRRRWV